MNELHIPPTIKLMITAPDAPSLILVFILGFLTAQLIKCIIFVVSQKQQHKKVSQKQILEYMTKSGGMPSGHAASFVAATMYIGLSQGFNSPLFGLAFCIAAIVIYDAMNVRYAVGEQGKILTQIIKKQKYTIPTPQIVEGHTLPQVIAGSILGFLIALIVFIL